MTAEDDFRRIFEAVDLLIVVDERKDDRTTTEPELLVARAFTNVGRSTLPLYRILAEGGAASWHAGEDRERAECLLTSPSFPDVMAQLDHADTRLYEHLFHDLEHFQKGGAADPNWRRITMADKALAEVWTPKAPRQARALFWFVECLLRGLAPRVGRAVRIRVIVDRQDWLTTRGPRLPVREPGFAYLGGRNDSIQAELFAILDKKHPGVLPYQPFLGLVDSEAWALGKQVSLRLADGTRVHDRCVQWLRDGRGDATELLREFNETFDRLYGHLANLKAYLHEAWNVWYPARWTDLNSMLESAGERW